MIDHMADVSAPEQGIKSVSRIEVHRKIIRADGSVEDKGLSAVWDADPERMAADIAAIGDAEGRGRVTPSPQMLAMTPEEAVKAFGTEAVAFESDDAMLAAIVDEHRERTGRSVSSTRSFRSQA